MILIPCGHIPFNSVLELNNSLHSKMQIVDKVVFFFNLAVNYNAFAYSLKKTTSSTKS